MLRLPAAALSALLLAPAVRPLAQAEPIPIPKPYVINSRVADEITLPDLDGKEHALFAEHPSQALVLVFWAYHDPVSLFYAPHLAELAKTYAGKAAVVLVDSNYDELVTAGDALAKLREVVAREKVSLPVLVDKDNKLADDFKAIANGQVFLVDANKFLRYHGGIDDDPHGELRKAGTQLRTWLENALKQVLAGERPKENWTRPSGRPIKRVPKALETPAAGPK
jgi:thiol-disulfide isomerase/thioredoxin